MLALFIILGVVAFLGVGGFIVWQVFGPGPIRGRKLSRANYLLKDGDWEAALDLIEPISHEQLNPTWQDRVDHALGECYDLATEQALKDKRYEEALEHGLRAAPLLRLKEEEQKSRVVEAMLAEVRRLFCNAETPNEVNKVMDLITRLFLIQSVCAEASFWLGLCLIRQNKSDEALRALTTAHEQAGKQYIDPALYLGMLYHSLGKPQDALKFLGEASRVDGTCPFVTFQMGLSAVAAGADPLIALKSLQRATGPKGLSIWLKDQERAWVEAFPESRSFIRRAASRHRYTCPVLGRDLNVILRAGLLAQAQSHYRLEQFQESADIYSRLLENTAPSAGLLRGLGLSLARLGRFDQAYKHLRTALELDESKDSFTAGYLALCGAMGKPTNADDRPKNIAWAIKLLGRYQGQNTGNAEWASLYSRVFAEARGLHMVLAKEDQQQLCNVLASVQAADPMAADGYLYLARSDKTALAPIHAWLYCRAAVTNEMIREGDLILFERTFQDPNPARGFFERQKWNFDDVEYAYLHRAAVHQPGQFPELLGPDYPKKGEAFLLKRSETEEAAKKPEAAIRAVEILLRLAPKNTKGLDRLACLAYRKGELDKALQLLERWRAQEPTNHWPLVRQAVIEEQRGNRYRRDQMLTEALGMTRGPVRAAVAYLGARLTLHEVVGGETAPSAEPDFAAPVGFLEECLREDPEHPQALWVLAALRSLQGDLRGLTDLAPRMTKADVAEPRYHLLGALCCLTAKQYGAAFEAGQRAAKEPSLQVEAYFILGLALMHVNKLPEAIQVFTKVANNEKAAAAPLARALLGKLSYDRSAYEDTIKWWTGLDPKARAGWALDEPLRQMVFLAGLTALQTGQFEIAAERFREAGKLGLREKRLGGLINLALIKAGQKLLFEDDTKK
jgi:tetratricopeptide (TPR) repeat protein